MADVIAEVRGTGIPIMGDDVDTDRIIPARFLKCVTFETLGKYAFYDERFDEHNNKKEHPMNDPDFEGASILIVGKNFGCGSSREHAPQALKRAGIKAIIGESFAEIFKSNCTTIGLPTVVANAADIESIREYVSDYPSIEVFLDLRRKKLFYGDISCYVELDNTTKTIFLDGSWDTISQLLQAKEMVREKYNELPYTKNFE